MGLFVSRILTKLAVYCCSPPSLLLGLFLIGDGPLVLGQMVASDVGLMFNLIVPVDMVDPPDT